METQFKKGVMDLCVLAILRKNEHYGYELVQEISKTISITEGTIYPILRRLKKEGYLQTYLKESTEGPSRKYYTLTKEGKTKADQLEKKWNAFEKKIRKILQ